MLKDFFSKAGMLKWLWITAIVIVFDQVTKYLANTQLVKFKAMEFIPMLDLTLMHNHGAAFSFLSQAGGWQRWMFSFIALAVSLFIVFWIKNLKTNERLQAISLALILGGALGNVIDRLFLGYVIDFLDFYYVAEQCLPLFGTNISHEGISCHWPAFNIADSAISIGVVLMIYDTIRSAFKEKQALRHSKDIS